MNNLFVNIKSYCSKALLLLIMLVFTIIMAKSEGYKIKIQVKGITDTVCYLVYYYGDKIRLADTTYVGKKGNFVFEGDSLLPGGIYIVAGQSNNKIFEMIIDKEQSFIVNTDTSDINGKIKFEGSGDNTLFFEYVNKNEANYREFQNLKKLKTNSEHNKDSVDYYQDAIDKLGRKQEEYRLNIIKEHPESFVSVFLKSMIEPKALNVPLLENGKEDSVYAYHYYKNHFWDEIDLTDDRLLRTPVLNNKIEKYFTKVLYQHPDTISKEADALIEKAKPDSETFKYLVLYLTYKYNTSKIMGFDEIFVHMVDNYYATGLAYWAGQTIVNSLNDRANALRQILIGSKAPELILLDTTGGYTSMHYSNAKYMVVLFYESDCGHCKKEIKKLKSWYDDSDFGLQVFAVCTDTSLVKWKKFVNERELTWINVNGTRSVTKDYHDLYDIRSTPTMFLLNNEKKIIAKRLDVEQLISFLNDYDKRKQAETEVVNLKN